MTPGSEDKRAAIGLSTNLSGQLVQAAVAILTVEGAYIAYALVSRETHSAFGVVAFSAAVAFVLSVYFSGKGITEARNSGFLGDWNLSSGKAYFNLQTLSLITGLVLLAAMLFLSGNSKESTLEARVDALSSEVGRLKISLDESRKISTEETSKLSARLDAESSKNRSESPSSVASRPKR